MGRYLGRVLGVPLVMSLALTVVLLLGLPVAVLELSEVQERAFLEISDKRGIDLRLLHREPDLDPDPVHLHTSLSGGVACDVPLCSQLGVDILEKGGNAADASVTVALCVGATNMFNSGIGGGGFITAKKYTDDKAISIDARETAPLGSDKYMFKGREFLSRVGGLAAGIPGEIKGLYTLFDLQGSGKVSWEELIMPVANMVRNGFNASLVLAAVAYYDKEILIDNYDDWSFLFREGSKNETVYVGDLVKQPALADTLEIIAKNGSDAIFYDPDGPIAKPLIQTVNSNGGIFTREDFVNYNVKVEDALKTTYLNNDVYTSAGASSGPALIHGLNIMDSYGEQIGGDMEPLATHRLVEAMKWMASSRSRLGDDEHTNMTEFVTSEDWAEYSKRHIDPEKTLKHWSKYKPLFEINEPHGTTHFSIVDREHNAVAMTSTINLLFGSLVRDQKTGIILNNEMDDFSTPGVKNAFGVAPSVFNFIAPRKRPLSSSVPTIIVNELGKPDLVIGAAGGSRILTSVFQAIVRVYSYNMPLLETIAYPRLHHQLIPDVVEHEPYIGSDITTALESKGHKLDLQPPKSVINAIRRYQGDWQAVSDYWRKRGEAAVPKSQL